MQLGRKYYRQRENPAQRPKSGNVPGGFQDQQGGKDGWNGEHSIAGRGVGRRSEVLVTRKCQAL